MCIKLGFAEYLDKNCFIFLITYFFVTIYFDPADTAQQTVLSFSKDS